MPRVQKIEDLIESAAAEARREEFPVDEPVYERVERDPQRPILFAGLLDAPVCILARDLGRDEVAAGQPLIGAGGRLVRTGIVAAWPSKANVGEPPRLEDALDHALLTNTVPFKPPGNKAYAESVRARFRPFVVSLLADFWRGGQVITLGTEAFRWFEPYAEGGRFDESAGTDARFDATFACRLPVSATGKGDPPFKTVVVRPLPHPSPLNRRWYSKFSGMLARRLEEVKRQVAESADPA
ncbi:MAG: uracil-DNA glycosylase family protein [Paludisphaera borealis]|uniref:uracil-DNA glycosylase family protein n=1 Tax=Paludisphaera borealis TaxID=1387353 RepID=UPI00283B1E53|nr:uracil-DNA glycosylase family protein [Paludisphaera borealis]MDR3621852.1 uracil-DNA glycosylase family protein [Paludisphaera borealis]